jgi:phospholipid-binding lipoprotein MlaA
MIQKSRFFILMLALVLTGCATSPVKQDPLEHFNRAMFDFNDTLDKVALKPAAEAYAKVTPSFVQTGVGNFFGNIGDVWTSVNNLLQGKIEDGLSDFARFTLNTTLGIGGLFDIASEAKIPKHKEDFGQTLGVWGVASGPYIVLPLLGSSTIRDTVALPLDYKADPWSYVYPVDLRNWGTVLRLVDQRASLLDASNLLEDAALDRYEFVRDGYLQRRQSKISDGGDYKPGKLKIFGKDAEIGPRAEPDADASPKEKTKAEEAK